ncbi:transmembrane protein [Legionella beliardensis]|uniref:Transmembrane protein n=1 Tax=Legionella beliardensis TaxID=91822 RepID=A0A378I1L4_9GAMM|nr:hypothetical protein [Legionella beliardensis]STX29049.1 transmembrane protein [Legionella beliardensis]
MMKERLLKNLNQWFRARNDKGNSQTFGSRNSYILPSSFGWLYAFVLITLFTGAINYQISLIFLLVFLLALIGIGSAWEAQANLKGLSVKLLAIDDAEVGQAVCINLLISPNNKLRYALEFQVGKQAAIGLEQTSLNEFRMVLPLSTDRRGYFKLPTIKIYTLYPLGLFKTWGYLYFDEGFYVYPQPVFPGFWPAPITVQSNNQVALVGDNEFYDLRQVENPWAQPNLIAWKIVAKDQGWHVKTMDSSAGNYWLFQLSDLPFDDLEKKLQYLSFWLQNAEVNQDLYSLKLGRFTTPLSHGKQHLQQCLRQLAICS